ncbi:MAG: DUF3263 domain-containing protein [Mycobacterium sp.]|nr:DUF3263 domain-containing protein [Mycobacterium sp.]
MAVDSLTEQQHAILAVERQFWRTAGAKEDAIRAIGLTVTRYYQLANQLLDNPAALAAEPVTVKRLQRIRSARHSSLAHAGSSRTRTANSAGTGSPGARRQQHGMKQRDRTGNGDTAQSPAVLQELLDKLSLMTLSRFAPQQPYGEVHQQPIRPQLCEHRAGHMAIVQVPALEPPCVTFALTLTRPIGRPFMGQQHRRDHAQRNANTQSILTLIGLTHRCPSRRGRWPWRRRRWHDSPGPDAHTSTPSY